MPNRGRYRNIVLKLALVVMSGALAAVGVFGWADAANAFRAYAANDWGKLDALWPLYAAACIGCLAAQIIAACATVNFARLAQAPAVWRWLAGAFYIAAVMFAAYSADKGAQVVISSAHRSAYEARELERSVLTAEIATLTRQIEEARANLPSDTANIPAQRQEAALAIFTATTAAAVARLPEAQRELTARQPLAREQAQPWTLAIGIFAIFLAWAIIEPWGYALAEKGREAPPASLVAPPEAPANKPANVHWLRRGVALLTLGWLSHLTTPQALSATVDVERARIPDPVEFSAWQDAKAVAFSMRDRFDVAYIAAKVRRDKSTVYRWFRERDKKLKAEVEAAAA